MKFTADGSPRYEVGETVVVLDGVLDIGTAIGLGGWQGKVSEILFDNKDGQNMLIEWDKLTLQRITPKIIEEFEAQGLGIFEIDVASRDLALVPPASTAKQKQEATLNTATQITEPIRITNETSLEEIQKLINIAKERLRHQPSETAEAHAKPAISLMEVFRQAKNLSPLFHDTPANFESLGSTLYTFRGATVRQVNEQQAIVDVHDWNERVHQIVITLHGDSLDDVTLSCTCPATTRKGTEQCLHMASAAHAFWEYAKEEQLPAPTPHARVQASTEWESRLSQALSERKPAKKSVARSLIVFSLSERNNSTWRLTPYIVPFSLLETELLDDRYALQQAISRLGRRHEIKEVGYYGNLPANPLYGSSEISNLARTIGLANYYQSGNPLSFALPYMHEALLFRGDNEYYYGNPFKEPIQQIDSEPHPLQINIIQDAEFIRLEPVISYQGEVLSLLAAGTHVVNVDPLWVLTNSQLLRLVGDGSVLQGLLDTREIVIPTAEKKSFVTRYLPKLLQNAEVSGDIAKKHETLTTTLTSRAYLSEKNDTIYVDLAFAYAGFEVALDTNWPETTLQYDEENDTLVTILRAQQEEEEAWRALSGFGLKREGDRFILRQKVLPVGLFTASFATLAS